MPGPLIWTATLLALIIAFGVWTHRRADLREAAIEARYPPRGDFVRIDGRDVHVVVEGPEDAPPLVLIHGAGGNALDMLETLGPHLRDRYRLFAVDRPGHGWTETGTPLFGTGSESVAEQAALLSRAVAELGAERPIVLGHSYGGAVAMAWALDHPAAAVVLVSGAVLPWPGPVHRSYRVIGSPAGAVLAPLASAYLPERYVEGVVEGVFAPQPVPPAYISRTGVMLATRTETLLSNARQVRRLRPEIVRQSERYGELTLPLEILHGTADTSVLPHVHALPLAEMLPHANLTLLDGIGHRPLSYAGAEIVAAVDRAAEASGLRGGASAPRL